ncbi:hypothetical protein [Parvibaculum sp.]|uniref:hypothetical protein n=1 Tax=Parvibaculum sp. TaxID=2024848 RepID=UPI00320F6E9E
MATELEVWTFANLASVGSENFPTMLIPLTRAGSLLPRDGLIWLISRQPKQSALSSENWTELERAVIKDMKWWDMDELMASDDIFYPLCLKEYLPPLLNGEYPAGTITIGL